MTFEQAAARQHLYASYYTVWLTSPTGEREYLGFTQRKSGTGLLSVMRRDSVQSRVLQFPGADGLRCEKKDGALLLSNGWKIEFGGTIRQEASRLTL